MSKDKFIKGGIIGVVVGAVAGVLFAPKAGKETREDIKNAATKAAKEAEKQLKELHGELKVKSDELKIKAEDVKGKAKDELDQLRSKADIVREKVSETISALREGEANETQVEKTVSEGKSVIKSITDKLK